MKIHALNKHSFTTSTCFFFILALCISSAVLSLSTHVVILQVSLGVGLSSVWWSTWLSLPLFLSAPVEPWEQLLILERILQRKAMVVTDIITRGNSQKLCFWKFRFGSKKNSCPRVVPPRDMGDVYPWRFPKTLPVSVGQRGGIRQCRPGLHSMICSHRSTAIHARLSCRWQNCCILPLINCSGTVQHWTVTLCSLHTLEGFPKTALLPELVLSRLT